MVRAEKRPQYHFIHPRMSPNFMWKILTLHSTTVAHSWVTTEVTSFCYTQQVWKYWSMHFSFIKITENLIEVPKWEVQGLLKFKQLKVVSYLPWQTSLGICLSKVSVLSSYTCLDTLLQTSIFTALQYCSVLGL